MVAGMNRGRRLAALEQRKRPSRMVSIPIIGAQVGETSDAAAARYVGEHGPLAHVDEDGVNIIVLVPVEPAHCAAI